MLDQAIRFGAILSQPEFRSDRRSLEVGSGDEGISVFIDGEVIGIDVQFRRENRSRITAVRASVTDLPFKDRAIGQVICSDMMEHLAAQDRKQALEELIRVTGKTLFLAFPCGNPARRTDQRLARLYQLLSIRTPEWLEEHLATGLPDEATISGFLDELEVEYRVQPGESCLAHFFVALLISMKSLNRIWRDLFSGRPERAKFITQFGQWPETVPYRTLWVIKKT